MAKEIVIQNQTNKVLKNEFIDFLWDVNEEYIPPINKCVNLSEYAEKLLKKANIVTARYKNILIGVCAFYCDENTKKSFITTIGLQKKFKKKGIGEGLLNEAVSISKKKKMNMILLEVNLKNTSAIMFYEKHGFSTSKVYEKIDLEGKGRKWKLMIKEI